MHHIHSTMLRNAIGLRPALILLAIIMMAPVAAAQKKIDDVADRFENESNVESTFSERRDPKTKKVTRISRVLMFERNDAATAFKRAFENERRNSVEATKTATSYTLKFIEKDCEMIYMLTNNGSRWSFIYRMNKVNDNNRSHRSKRRDHTMNSQLPEIPDIDSYGCSVSSSTSMNNGTTNTTVTYNNDGSTTVTTVTI